MHWLLRDGILRRDWNRAALLRIPPLCFYLIHSLKRDNRSYRRHSDTFRPGADRREYVEGDLLLTITVLERHSRPTQ
jgi:hypothetical protein